MPHNPELDPKQHAFPRRFGQIPLTRVRDYSQSVRVDLIKHDDPVAMLDGTYDFVKATWSEDGREASRATHEEKQEALRQMLSGKTLQLGLETVQFMFRISGITRIDTHQIVRQRIGVTFSQQCSGDQFWNHHDMLVEPSIYYLLADVGDYSVYNDFVQTALRTKKVYQEALDCGVSVQAARSILPHCLETFVFMRVDLATLLFFHQKRIDDGSQTWQMNEIAQQMADRVSEVFPELAETFERNKKRFRFQVEASKDRANTYSTGLYLPSPDEFEYHNDDFLYPETKNRMHLVKEYMKETIPTKYYWGTREITSPQYIQIHRIYSKLDEYGLSNEEVLRKAHRINLEIASDILFSKNK